VKRLVFGGCGCSGAMALLVLTIPLLFFGIGNSDTANASSGAAKLVAAGAGSCNAAVHCQSIPQELANVPLGFYPDGFTKPPGQCTSWAAALWPGHRGRGVSWSGDAWEWYANAASQGYAVSGLPSVGAVVVFARSSNDGGEWGHVAVVLAVAAMTVQISEMNYSGRFVVDERDVALAGSGIIGFIPVPADAAP
jgi:hypothetical protein